MLHISNHLHMGLGIQPSLSSPQCCSFCIRFAFNRCICTCAVPQMAVVNLTDTPGRITCPHCMTDVITEIESIYGLLTWLICGSLVFFMCWLCCWIPFCVDACKDVKHTCPNCKKIIRIYKHL
uniref:LITAF domain-containing protein n=1 Tax=Cyprinus carpio TaxID=7962 RepID=A0A8C1XZN2_CYPCA